MPNSEILPNNQSVSEEPFNFTLNKQNNEGGNDINHWYTQRNIVDLVYLKILAFILGNLGF